MTNADDVATAALVVGLVALIVAAGQLLQQMFSTADGYRRCKQSVIGPWANKTRRKWHWGQFRFETRFTTPEIVLYDSQALQKSRKRVPGSMASAKMSPGEILEFDGDNVPYELRETIKMVDREDDEPGSGDMVSWTSLLRQLYKWQSQRVQSYHVNILESKMDTDIVAYETKIGVIYHERTWDLMPPDSIRPMASSRLGTMIVLATRLGMTWENVNVGAGILRAVGNGHSLISTIIQGMGIVFQYSYNPDVDTFDLKLSSEASKQGLIPRRSIDMMACGILPGNATLSIPPIPLKGKSLTETATLLTSALHWLKVNRITISEIANLQQLEKMEQDGYNSEVAWPIHDMVALLSDFQPLRSSIRTHVVYPIQTNAATSIFSLPSTRMSFYVMLTKHKHLTDPNRLHLRHISTEMGNLRLKYASFGSRNQPSVLDDVSKTYEDKINMIADLRRIETFTTHHFITKVEPNLKYTDLVAAHISLAANAIRGRADADPGAIARYYVDNVPFLIEEVRTRMDPSQNANISNEEIEDAWWTLMLRGIVWRMSVSFSHQETIIPSRLYYDQTPVFIM